MKSKLAIGCLCWVLCATPAFAQAPAGAKPSTQRILSAGDGRYVFGQVSDARTDPFLLDTQTGRLWVLVNEKNEEKQNALKLKPVAFIQVWGGDTYMPDTQQEVEAQKASMLMQKKEEMEKNSEGK